MAKKRTLDTSIHVPLCFDLFVGGTLHVSPKKLPSRKAKKPVCKDAQKKCSAK